MIDFTDEHKVKAICATLARVLPDHSIFWPMGSGGQGLVVYTHHGPTDREVAVKVLDAGLLTTADARRRFDIEIRALGRLHHDHIVRVHDSGSVGDLLYFTMEYIQGFAVTDWRLMCEPAPAAVVQRFLQVAGALAHAHRRGVIHRDLKPDNILIDDSDGEHHGRACVVDFGMAKLIDECDDGTRSSSMQHVGTLRYMSPEQIAGDPLDSRTDLYSLGVVMYEVLSKDCFPYPVDKIGKPGIMRHIRETEPTSLRRINPAVNADLSSIVHKCLEKDREQRYRTADELCDDLEHWQRGEAVAARSDNRWYKTRKAARRHWKPLATACAFVLLLTAGAVSTTILWQRADSAKEIAREAATRAENLAATYGAALKIYDLVKRGSEARDEGRTEEALALWHEALQLDATAPMRNTEIDRMRYEVLHRLCEFHLVERDTASARPFCDDALAVAGRYAEKSEDADDGWQRRAGFAEILRGRLARADKDYEASLAAFTRAATIMRESAEQHHEIVSRQSELAAVLSLTGSAARRLDRMSESRAYYQEEYAIRLALHEAEPHSGEHALNLANATSHTAVWHMVQKTDADNRQALDWITKAESRIEEMETNRQCEDLPRKCRQLKNDLAKNRRTIERRLSAPP